MDYYTHHQIGMVLGWLFVAWVGYGLYLFTPKDTD
jgi:hypothetical protein